MSFGSTIHGTGNTGNRTTGAGNHDAGNNDASDHENGHRSLRSVQLRLMGTDPAWRIDERTKRIGREGIAQARAALAAHVEPDNRIGSALHVDRAA
jgi:hypothetical protein